METIKKLEEKLKKAREAEKAKSLEDELKKQKMAKINNIYRIQKRVWSPDVIEKKIPGTKDSWKVYIVPTGNRNDMIAHEIIKTLQ